jgi:hypothetical protein
VCVRVRPKIQGKRESRSAEKGRIRERSPSAESLSLSLSLSHSDAVINKSVNGVSGLMSVVTPTARPRPPHIGEKERKKPEWCGGVGGGGDVGGG